MNEVLTRAELEARYDGEWVLVGDPMFDESQQVRSGWVIAHNRDRDAMYRAAEPFRGKVSRSASLCLVKVPDNMVFAL